MTVTEKVKAYILAHQEITNDNILAEGCGSTKNFIKKCKTLLRAEEKLPKYDPSTRRVAPEEKKQEEYKAKAAETRFSENQNGAEYSFNSSKRIVTKEDLIAACDIDLSVWVIERWVCNKWEVGAKDAEKNIVVSPLFQIKLWLKPKLTEKQSNILDAIEEIIKKYTVGGIKQVSDSPARTKKAIKATISDMHVGLEPNPSGKSIFNYKYDEKEFNANLSKVYNSILKEKAVHGKFDILILDDLGDGLDGWNNTTTRGGHALEQNMDNIGQFKAYVSGKLWLIESLISSDIAEKIMVRNVTDDNHAGSFAYIANAAIEMILNRTYDKKIVNFYILTKFIEHFEYGDHTFILTHGKDGKFMFKGLPVILNDKATRFINDYINHYRIGTRFIHVEKGDSHQLSFQKTKNFDYRNYMSFAPPSSYIQTNFGDCYSGYSIQVVPKHSSEISHTDYFFDLRVVD